MSDTYLKDMSIMTETQKETLETNGTVTSGDKTVNLEDNSFYYVVNNKMPALRQPEVPPSEDSVVAIGTDGKDKLLPLTEIHKRYLHSIELAVYESETSYANCYLAVLSASPQAITVDYLLEIFAAEELNNAGDQLLARIPCTGYINHNGSYRGVQCIERITRTSDGAVVWRVFAVDTSGIGQYHMSSLNVVMKNTVEI